MNKIVIIETIIVIVFFFMLPSSLVVFTVLASFANDRFDFFILVP